VSYKLIRFLLTLVGIASLAGFGWSFYDFIIHKAEYNQPLTSEGLKGLNKQVKPPKQGKVSDHLDDWLGNYDQLYKLNVIGYVEVPKVESGPIEPVKPKPRFGPDDVTLSSIIFSKGGPSAAYLIPAGDVPQGVIPTGDYYLVGDSFEVPSKPGVSLKVKAIRESEVDLETTEGEDGFTLAMLVSEVDAGVIMDGSVEGPIGNKRAFPKETEMIAIDDYVVGTEDLEKYRTMADDQIFSEVRVQQARDAQLGVRGLRITSIKSGSLFERIGLQQDDVVLSVNGFPAKDRADLLSQLRNAAPQDSVSVSIERRGGKRTLTYRIPR
jgi:hypothetical protein